MLLYTFNRTMLELKLRFPAKNDCSDFPFNRTMLELKFPILETRRGEPYNF